MSDQTPGWYARHEHGDGQGRHLHHTATHHQESVSNPRANDHCGVRVFTTIEDARRSPPLQKEIHDA